MVGIDDDLDLLARDFLVPPQMAFIRGYCARHENSDYSDAVETLYRRLGCVSVKRPGTRD